MKMKRLKKTKRHWYLCPFLFHFEMTSGNLSCIMNHEEQILVDKSVAGRDDAWRQENNTYSSPVNFFTSFHFVLFFFLFLPLSSDLEINDMHPLFTRGITGRSTLHFPSLYLSCFPFLFSRNVSLSFFIISLSIEIYLNTRGKFFKMCLHRFLKFCFPASSFFLYSFFLFTRLLLLRFKQNWLNHKNWKWITTRDNKGSQEIGITRNKSFDRRWLPRYFGVVTEPTDSLFDGITSL